MTSTQEHGDSGHQYKNGNWPLEDLEGAEADIAAGATYSEATEGREISRATLHSRIHKKCGDEKKPKRGPRYKFSTKDELHLVAFTNYCWDRNIPKTEEMLRPDVVHYLETEGIPNRFKNNIPGRTWFRNLREHHSDLIIPTNAKASEYRYMHMSEKEWVADRSRLIRTSGDQDFPSLRHIFMIELDSIHNALHTNIRFDVLVAYNAKAEVLLPFLLYEGDLSEDLQHYYHKCFAFIKTTDGHIDHNALHECILYVNSFMIDQELTYPAIIYLQPEVVEFFSLASWKFTTEQSILVNPIPRNVFRWMTSADLGLFAKVKAKMYPLLLKRIWPKTKDPAREIVLHAFHEVLVNAHMLGHLKAGFQKLKLLTLKRTKKPKCDILHELLGSSKHFRKVSSQQRKRPHEGLSDSE